MPSPLDALPKVGAPATRALSLAGFTSLGQLGGVCRADLTQLHGLGPKAIRIIENELERHGLRLE